MRREQGAVLLVEDEINDVLLIRRAFTKAQLPEPLSVGDGEAAMAYLAGRDRYADREQYPLPVLVLLDLKLPRKSGLEVLEWLRAQPGLRRTPVVMLTSSEATEDINQAYDLGANSYLVKPIGSRDLLEMVRTLGLYWLVHNQPPERLQQ